MSEHGVKFHANFGIKFGGNISLPLTPHSFFKLVIVFENCIVLTSYKYICLNFS